MQCSKCRFENTERAKTCARCGAVLNLGGPKPQPPARNKRSCCGIIGCMIAALLLIALVVIVFPMFARKREKARSTSCIGNVKQLELGMHMYANDHDGVMPPASEWCDATLPYAPHWAIYICPDAKAHWGEGVGTYAMNDGLSGRDLSAVPAPEATICIFDSTVGWNMHGGPSLVVNRHKKRTKGLVDRIVNGRKYGANVGFVDGHTKWVDPGSMSRYTWSVAPPPAASGTTGGP